MKEIAAKEVLKQLETICLDKQFSQSKQLPKLLTFLTKETLEGRGNRLKQYSIGLAVFEREESFDPQVDPVVRIQIGRLRNSLEKYYKNAGKEDLLTLKIPKGNYQVEVTKKSRRKHAYSISAKILEQRPSIAILPFTQEGVEHKDNYIFTGLAEEVSTCLTQFENVSTLAYGSSRHLSLQGLSAKEIADHLSARYYVTGHILAEREQVILTLTLVDNQNSQQLWACSFNESNTGNNQINLVQKVAFKTANAIADEFGVVLRQEAIESAKKIQDTNVFDAILRFHYMQLTMAATDFTPAFESLKQATEIAPQCARVWAMLGTLYLDSHIFGFDQIEDSYTLAHQAMGRALTLDANCVQALNTQCYFTLLEKDAEELANSAKAMLASNKNSAFGLCLGGFWLYLSGDKQGLEFLEEGQSLNPFHPSWLHFAHFLEHFEQENYQGALQYAKKFAMPDFFMGPIIRITCYTKLGKEKLLQLELKTLVTIQPDIYQRFNELVRVFILSNELAQEIALSLEKALIKHPKIQLKQINNDGLIEPAFAGP